MTGINILLWVAAVALVAMLAITVGSILYGLITMNRRRRSDFYDRVENALSKRKTDKRQ